MIKLAGSFAGGLAAARSQRPSNYLLGRTFLFGSCDDTGHMEGHGGDLDELSEEEIVWGVEEELEAKDAQLGRKPNVAMAIQKHGKHVADHQPRHKKKHHGNGPYRSSQMQIRQALQRSPVDDPDDDHREAEDEKEEVEEGVRMLLPPHEILAREYAASGTGRIPKGMNLCRLRNAVWSQTGFAD